MLDDLETFECTDCGCLVIDTDTHRKWHEAVSGAMQSAYRADMWTRPIG